nr:unnamed protein product [Spirometra erinaceieuropaei]
MFLLYPQGFALREVIRSYRETGLVPEARREVCVCPLLLLLTLPLLLLLLHYPSDARAGGCHAHQHYTQPWTRNDTNSITSDSRGGVQDYTCPHCDRTFTSHISLIGHLRIHRTEAGEPVPGAPTYTHRIRLYCPHCPRIFTLCMGLFGHMRIHGAPAVDNRRLHYATSPSFPESPPHNTSTLFHRRHPTATSHASETCASRLAPVRPLQHRRLESETILTCQASWIGRLLIDVPLGPLSPSSFVCVCVEWRTGELEEGYNSAFHGPLTQVRDPPFNPY